MGTDPIDRGLERLLGSPAGRPARRSQPAPRHAAAGRGGDSLRRSRGRHHGLLHHRLQGRRPLPHVLPGCALREEDHLLRREPRRFKGSRLEINYATSAAGGIWIEIQDPKGQTIPGFTLDECPKIIGDQIERTVAWKGDSDLSSLSGKPVRMRVVLKNADLYSIRFH